MLDDEINEVEFDLAIRTIGNGLGVDGLPGDILNMVPPEMKKLVLILMKRVFTGVYPSEWEKQILHSIPKPGHSPKVPKLRGIAVPTLMSKLYDNIIDDIFNK